jgi:hypothetical protein
MSTLEATVEAKKEKMNIYRSMNMTAPVSIGRYIIVAGDPENGFWYMGPFATHERARQHGEGHMRSENTWWVAEILTPDKHEGRI